MFAAVVMISMPALAQHRCFSTEYMNYKIEQDPSIVANMEAIEKHTQEYIDNLSDGSTERAALVTIPVVYHVVYNGSAENVPDYVILGQNDVINEDFRALNADLSTVVSAFAGITADTEVEFCMASVDPNGNPTNGITRTTTTNGSFSAFSDNVKFTSSGGKDAWPTDEYLNIWVCDIGFGILGYAQFPGGPANTDGVVIDYKYTGRDSWSSGPSAPYDLGRTLTHEIGHWLNLYHIFSGCGTGTTGGDFVADTPPQSSSTSGCPTSKTSCSTLSNVQNYMDYSYDDCLVMFTQGQAARMQATWAPGGPRKSNIDAAASLCGAVAGCDVPANPTSTIVSAPTTATVSWDPVAGAVSYDLQGRRAGAGWRDFSTSGTSFTYSNFVGGFTYEWRVSADCGSSSSAQTAIQSFFMPTSKIGELGNGLAIFPVPASDVLSVNLQITDITTVEISILDLSGKVISTETETSAQGQYTKTFDVSSLANGTYFVQLVAGGERLVERFTVAH